QKWPERAAKISFWSLNIGLAWMVFATLLPLGVIQLWYSVNDGYFEARELNFITAPGNALLEWLRMPGDLIFIIGGVLPFLWITWVGVRHRIRATTLEVPVERLFVEEQPAAVAARGGPDGTARPARGAGRGDRPSNGPRYGSDRRGPDDDQGGDGS
ncbi:MAG: nitric-oxide reductase large subunit, partial [Georgenia sp.]